MISWLKSECTSMSVRRIADKDVSVGPEVRARSVLDPVRRKSLGSVAYLGDVVRRQVGLQVVLEEHADRNAAPARVQDRLGDDLRVDLLHRDVERLLGVINEPYDDRFEIVGRAELGGTDERLDLAACEVGHLGSRTEKERGGKGDPPQEQPLCRT